MYGCYGNYPISVSCEKRQIERSQKDIEIKDKVEMREEGEKEEEEEEEEEEKTAQGQ